MRPAARRLREYKGVTYQDGAFHYSAHWSPRFSAIRACVDFICTADDADHAALLDIKANPYEPVETLEDVVREWLRSHSFRVENEPFTDLCTRIRTWMAQQTPTAALGGAP